MASEVLTEEKAQAFAAEMLQATNDAEERVKHGRENRIADALERIATALETQVAAQEASAAFARLLTRGVDPAEAAAGGFEDYREEPDGLKVLVGGAWRPATLAEEQEIADMNQKRKRR